jgi:hypothetical protein
MAALLPYRIGKRKAKKNPKRRMGLVQMQRAFGRHASSCIIKPGRRTCMAANSHDMAALKC